MAHIYVKEAEEVLDKEFKVLDKGFVRLVDYYGSDKRVVQAARVSYGEGTKTVREDEQLIDYLLKNDHTSPFEQVVFTFHCKMPVFVARQWIRHRTARVNEISGRYSIMKNEYYLPDLNKIQYQNVYNKQGRSGDFVPEEVKVEALKALETSYNESLKSYNKLLDLNIAKELSRICLPLSLYTEWYWQIDLKNLLHFLKLRMDAHAQYEIRVYANAISEFVKIVCPYTWKAFNKHVFGSIKFNAEELNLIKDIFTKKDVDKTSKEYILLKDKLDFI